MSAIIHQEFKVDEAGAVITQPVPKQAKSNNILLALSDPNMPIGETSRLITIEIASVYAEMTQIEEDPTNRMKMKSLHDQARLLRELQKSLTESDILSKKDILSIDGPKFQFVFLEIMGYFKTAIKEAGFDEAASTNIIRQFEDIVRINEEKLRKDVDKIGTNR
jgi:hypothetical protein